MTSSSTDQARIPGVRYRRVKLTRPETTVIDGVAETRHVTYTGWEPVPPRDWDTLILRGLTGVTVVFTGVAITATTASVGGLLSPLVPHAIAYAMASVFPVAWMYCLAIEWLNRTAPDRARPAQVGGWITLALSMAAVAVYGANLHQVWAGVFGAGIDLLAKTFWLLLLREHAVPLNAGVAHWVQQQEQRLAGRHLLAGRLEKLDRTAAYQRAIGGSAYEAADAILARAGAGNPQQAPSEPAPEPAPASAPAPADPAAPAVPAPSTGAAPSVAPVAAPAPVSAAQPVAPTPAQPPAAAMPGPALQVVGGITYIADTVREALKANPGISDDDLIAYVAGVHGTSSTLASTVTRTRRRIENPAPTKRKRA